MLILALTGDESKKEQLQDFDGLNDQEIINSF
jgi:hypothetical protein